MRSSKPTLVFNPFTSYARRASKLSAYGKTLNPEFNCRGRRA